MSFIYVSPKTLSDGSLSCGDFAQAYKECINLNIFYKCPYDKCGKVYSNEIQLNVHILSKHNGGTKKARLNYILKAWNALNEKKPIPECEFSLPESF